MKKIFSLMLMLALALPTAFFMQPPMPVHADEQEVIKKHIDIGCTQSWSTIIPEADYRREAKTKGWMDYTVMVYTKGGGVNGVEFCNSVPLTFTINGDMYEDDVTVDRR